jgi:KDO2-lipid IV(A) lauroyltransferase
MKKLKHIIEFLAIILPMPFLVLIPYRLRIIIGGLLGLIAYYCYRKRRAIALGNIKESFPDMKREWHRMICRNSFGHFGKTAMEFIQLMRYNKIFADKYIELEGKAYIDEALNKGKGIIGICPHLGNWEMVAAYISSIGYPVSVIMKRQSNHYMNRFIEEIRSKLNLGLIYKSKSGFLISRALKRNNIIGFVADQDAGRNGIFVNFFNRPASTALGPARFASLYKSPVMLFLGIRKKKGRFTIIVTPALEFDYNKADATDETNALFKNTELWVTKTEEYIKEYPDQYFWMHRRWKTKPG